MEKIRLEQTTAVGIRGMRGMSSVDKKLVSQSGTTLFGTAKVPTTPPLNEFSCVCATGWTGPTCEISKCIKFYVLLFDFILSCAHVSKNRRSGEWGERRNCGETRNEAKSNNKIVISKWFLFSRCAYNRSSYTMRTNLKSAKQRRADFGKHINWSESDYMRKSVARCVARQQQLNILISTSNKRKTRIFKVPTGCVQFSHSSLSVRKALGFRQRWTPCIAQKYRKINK